MIEWNSIAYSDSETPPDRDNPGLKIVCTQCGVVTRAKVQGCFVTPENKYHRLPHGIVIMNFLLECEECHSAMLHMWTRNRLEDEHLVGDPPIMSVGRLTFPEPGPPIIKDADPIPAAVLADIAQADLCKNAGGIYGAAMLYRRACQYICLDQGCSDKDLKGQISELVQKGKLTVNLGDMVHNIRLIANEVAHPNPSQPGVITHEDVSETREYIDQLLQAIYINPSKVEAMQKSLQSRNVKGS